MKRRGTLLWAIFGDFYSAVKVTLGPFTYGNFGWMDLLTSVFLTLGQKDEPVVAPPPGPAFGKPIEPVVAFCIVLFMLFVSTEIDGFEDLLTAIYRLVIFIFKLLPLMISSALMSLGFVIEFERELVP